MQEIAAIHRRQDRPHAPESEVAVLLVDGRTTREIAIETGHGETTIRRHLRHIFNELGVGRQRDVARLVRSLDGIPKPGLEP